MESLGEGEKDDMFNVALERESEITMALLLMTSNEWTVGTKITSLLVARAGQTDRENNREARNMITFSFSDALVVSWQGWMR